MTLQEAMAELENLGSPEMRAFNRKRGAPENQFGLKLGDIRNVAKKIKSDHDLALQLWETGNLDARLLALLVMKPKQLSEEQLEQMVSAADYAQLADWVNSYVMKLHPAKESLRQRWMHSAHPWLARSGWSLTTERVGKDPEGLDLSGLLDRIDKEMGDAPEPTKWTMNYCLWTLGVNFVEHRERAIAIGERVGAYKDYPCSKGCISPYAPIAIRELAARQTQA